MIRDVKMELKPNTQPLKKLTSVYLNKFFKNKNLPQQEWEIITDGVTRVINNQSVIKSILTAEPEEQRILADTLYELESTDQDINQFLKHLASESYYLNGPEHY